MDNGNDSPARPPTPSFRNFLMKAENHQIGAYIRGAAINEEKVKGSNKVIVITPRWVGWKDDETSIFYIK